MSNPYDEPREPHRGPVDRWATEMRGDEVAERRRRRSALNAQASEEATLAGTLVDLGEAGVRVSMALANGARRAGVVVLVGADFCRLDTEHGPLLVPLDAISHVRTDPEDPRGRQRGDREITTTLRFSDVLLSLAQDHAEVRLESRHGADLDLAGRLVLCGPDLLGVEPAGGERTYVALAAVAAVGLFELPLL